MDRGDKDPRPTDMTRRRGSAREKTPPEGSAVKKTQQQPEEGSTDLEKSNAISPEVDSWIRRCAQELKIRKEDRIWAAEVVNDFRDNLLKFLKNSSEQLFFHSAEFLTTGSYFEKVKIYSPDEFDMMLKLQAPALLSMTPLDDGLFYRLDLNRPSRSRPIKAFLLENERTVSSSKVLNEMYRLVRKFLKTYKVPDARWRWEVNRKRLTSPAVTLSLCRTDSDSEELISVDVVPALMVHPNQSWPQAVRSGPRVDDWLGKKVKQEIKSFPCVFVPKRLKGRNAGEDAKESWRISFSLIEKEIITNHGNTKTCCENNSKKCCRKQCLMLLKSLIEGLKQRFPEELEHLCSYHGKTAFLHMLSISFTDAMWSPKKLPFCFLTLLKALEDYARGGVLPHFFVPDCNLFSTRVFPRKSLALLVSALEEQRREGLPLLRPPAPASPLRPVRPLEESSSEPPAPAAPPVHAVPLSLKNKLMLLFALVLGFCVLFLF